jgi:(1->4)-alpha-D-glucan 1-alpha-D-glucosylmutase
LAAGPAQSRRSAALEDYAKRIRQWQQKALREAKLQSSWSAPNDAYEQATEGFHPAPAVEPGRRTAAHRTGQGSRSTISVPGALNGLAQTLLRMTVPGVPDLYQGNEFWDFSLVDPDNRRPVDYASRQQALQQPLDLPDLLANWRDGRIKQALIAQTEPACRARRAVSTRDLPGPRSHWAARHIGCWGLFAN